MGDILKLQFQNSILSRNAKKNSISKINNYNNHDSPKRYTAPKSGRCSQPLLVRFAMVDAIQDFNVVGTAAHSAVGAVGLSPVSSSSSASSCSSSSYAVPNAASAAPHSTPHP